MAGMRTVEELLSRAPGRYAITVFGAEPHPNYNRIMLSSVLAGEKTLDEIVINPLDWYAERGITLVKGDPVAAIDPAARTVTSAAGRPCALRPADAGHRIEAAGAADARAGPARRLRLPRHRRRRDHDRRRREKHKRAVVIGGGLLGLEAAWGLQRRGMAVSRHSPDADPDGATARRGRRADCCSATSTGAASRSSPTARPRKFSARSAPKACASPTAAKSRPTSSCWPSASGPISISARQRAWTSTAASWSATTCAPATTEYLRGRRVHRASGQVFGLVAPIWEQAEGLRRPARRRDGGGLRAACPVHQPEDHRHRRVLGRRAGRGRRSRRRDHAARRRAAAATKSSSCATESWSAPCSTAMSPTGPGMSS